MSLVIRAAARTLPAAIRDRYREQWLADARDATEAGLRPASIALAALAFAVTIDRPLPSRPVPTAQQRAQRSRLAVGLALSAALLALSVYPAVGFQGVTDLILWDFTRFFLGMLLIAYGVLAPIVALVLVRGARHRTAVVLLALACTAPIADSLIDTALPWQWSVNMYATPGTLAYLGAAVLVAAASVLLWTPAPIGARRAPVVGGLVVWLVTALGLVYANSIAWSGDLPLGVIAEDPAVWALWQALLVDHDATVTAALWWWAIAGAVVGILVFVIARRMSERGATAVAVAAGAISLLGASGVFGLLELGISQSVLPVLLDPLRLVARVLLVATTLVAVGGARLTRVGHRHDVEGAVELL